MNHKGCDDVKTSDQLTLGCVILAAGNSTRFGDNKLLVEIDGKMMIERALEAIPEERFSAVAVVTQYESIVHLAERYGYQAIVNRRPDLGISHSVMLGTNALKDTCDGILYQVADQPWLRCGSVSSMLDLFCENPERIVSMSSDGKRGNPCIFPEKYFDELCRLSGDRGGRAVIKQHEDDLILFEVSASELTDIDTPRDISDRIDLLSLRGL